MSTNKTPIHMRLYTLGFWYSINRRNGQSRIQALRGAWAMARVRWTWKVRTGAVTVGGLTIKTDGGVTIKGAIIGLNGGRPLER